MLPRSDIRAYIRQEAGQLDSAKVNDSQIDQYINLAQQKIQMDTFPVNFKAFMRTAVFTGNAFAQPSNLLQVPNAIINLRVSTGTRAAITVAYTSPTGSLIHTYKQPGTVGNSVNVSCDGGTFGNPAAGTVQCVLSGGTFFLDFASGVLTGSQIAALFNADPIYSQYFICSTSHPSAVIVPSQGTADELSGGTGSGYYPADEMSRENFIRLGGNFSGGGVTSPKYCRIGNANGRLIEVKPDTVTYAEMDYYYRVADITTDTQTIGLPAETEELVLLEVQRRFYEKLENAALMNKAVNEFNEKMKQYLDSYQNKRVSETAEKQRQQAADIEN